MNGKTHLMKDGRLLVVGDLMLDRYWGGHTQRISPEAPVPVVNVLNQTELPGGAGNVALNSAGLGAQVSLMSIVGNDADAELLTQTLKKAGIHCLFATLPDIATITKLRVMSQNQQLIRLDFEKNLGDWDSEFFVQKFRDHVKECDLVVFSDYAKGTLKPIRELIAIAKAADKEILVDPKGTDFNLYKGATMLTPNLSEFEAVVGACAHQEELVAKATRLISDVQLSALLITQGEQGMTLIEQSGNYTHYPTQAKEVYDVTGAGDTVIATLAASIACGQSFPDAAQLANVAAGIVVGKLGTSVITLEELQQSLDSSPNFHQGKIELPLLLQAVRNFRNAGERIVFTNGCFDLLHPGHVHYLEKAKKLGDKLIVAVNDDDSVKRLKGSDRPINTLSDRMSVLAGLRAVDWVVAFSEDTPQNLIEAIQPDYLVKGGDYTESEVVGGQWVKTHGGKVVLIDFVEGYSSSAIIEQAQKV